MDNQTPFLFEDLDIRITKISNVEEEIKGSNEDRNISSCDWKSKPRNSSKDRNTATEITTQDTQEKRLNYKETGYSKIDGKVMKVFNKTESGKFQCTECEKQYTKHTILRIHYIRDHTDKVYSCTQCLYKSKGQYDLQNHIKRRHSNNDPKDSSTDDNSSPQIVESTKHKVQNHQNREENWYNKTKDGKYSCINCSKQFLRHSNTNRHYRKEHLDIVYDCTHCNYSTKDKYLLKVHIKYKHSESGLRCEYCQQPFQTEYAHREHLTKAHNFKCGQCDKAFIRNDTLQLHIKIDHEGKETSHHCTICKRKVLHLKEHNDRVHRKIEVNRRKSFECLKCKAKFKNKGLLKKHKCIKPIIRYY